MPHFIVEYAQSQTNDITVEKLQSAVFEGALLSDLFGIDDIKVRLIPFTHFQVGQTDKAFIHVTARILPGRTNEQKQQLSQGILQQLHTMALDNISLTVEVVDIDKSSYAKAVL